jgi:UrcA family protein
MNSNVKSNNRIIRGCAAAVLLACASVAFSAPAGDDVRSETVKFADLDVGTTAGAEALYGRIHAAARRVCEQPAGELGSVRPCMANAESQAIGKVNSPLLTAFYQKKTGNRPQTITASR